MIRINQLKLSLEHTEADIRKKAAKLLKVQENDISSMVIVKKSIDARKKSEIKFVYTVDIELQEEEKLLKKVKNSSIMLVKKESYCFPEKGDQKLEHTPVIAGSGPAGLFCAYLLAKHGYAPIVLERGEEVEERIKTVSRFWETGELNLQSNIQFGEGGAGTFSDGKLNTLVKDTSYRNRFVLETFVKAGAPSDIMVWNKPHIGTDILTRVVKNMREEIISLGGSFRFRSQMTGLEIENGRIRAVRINEKESLACSVLVLAIGHSARDTFSLLFQKGLPMEAKSFAVGVRVEHPQKMINAARYGKELYKELPAADYKVAKTLKNGRGVYSFCMCPGGYVVNASSEEGLLAVNGMSYHARSSDNANSAIIVSVTPEDFGSEHPLAGIEFQRKLERAAYQAGNRKIPVQCLEDFLQKRPSKQLGNVIPCTKGAWELSNIYEILPAPVSESIAEGMEAFGGMIQGFDRPDTLLLGVESRTSSPVRILRGPDMQSSVKGIYPCGEGAGYAGGITSAAMDGIKIAEAIAGVYGNK